MDLNGLSADQAPPISAPIRFFLTAPIFGVIAGLLILLCDPQMLISRYSIESIVITHAITIGFLGFVMLGALTQMLPVLAGVKISKIDTVAKVAHIFLVFGTLFMIFGLLEDHSKLILASSVFLGIGFLALIVPMLLALSKVVHVTASVRAMITSLVFAFLIVLMGMHLLASYGTDKFSSLHVLLANVHSVWAIFGFAGVLIIGVSFHVLPMFYVAPRFKPFCKQKVVWLISFGLLLWLVLNIFLESYSTVAKIWVALFFWAFATTVFLKLYRRRRPISDVTVWYWRTAAIFMTLGTFAWAINDYYDSRYIVIVSILIGGGFIFSIMSGMLYKIVPFLVWFHLNAKGYMSIPTMNDMIDKRLAKTQFILFLISLVGFVVSFFILSILPIFAITFIVSMLILEYNVIAPVLIYRKIIKTKPEFDMSAFNISVEGIE
ncbi:MAG: hypothetical protein OQK48_04500 [Sulfurimonas sp.]|nr:hypothetical protein [Sulfurimonas sp.]